MLRNRIFLRPIKQSGLIGEASHVEQGVIVGDHVVDSETHSPRFAIPATEAATIEDSGSSPLHETEDLWQRSNEVDGEQRSGANPARIGREHPATAVPHRQSSPEEHRQPAPAGHTSTNRHEVDRGPVTRSKSKRQRAKKTVRFDLGRNKVFEYRYHGQRPE